MADEAAIARRALPLIDLTDLSEASDEAAVRRLCARAATPHGSVAAVCIWPRFVRLAKDALAGTGVRVATVVNFPAGGTDTVGVVAQAEKAVAEGADEIDQVFAYRAFAAGRRGFAETQVTRVKRALPEAVNLKVILETGEIRDPTLIRHAAEAAIGAGADFIKTSTGKTPISATSDAAAVMLEAIRDSGRPVGLKPSGGIRTVAEAGRYLDLADSVMGPGWATPATFRFGASGLLDAVLAAIEGRPQAAAAGY